MIRVEKNQVGPAQKIGIKMDVQNMKFLKKEVMHIMKKVKIVLIITSVIKYVHYGVTKVIIQDIGIQRRWKKKMVMYIK